MNTCQAVCPLYLGFWHLMVYGYFFSSSYTPTAVGFIGCSYRTAVSLMSVPYILCVHIQIPQRALNIHYSRKKEYKLFKLFK